MTTPTIEIEATEQLEIALQIAVRLLSTAGRAPICTDELKMVYANVVKARCLRRRFDEQQISLRLPTP